MNAITPATQIMTIVLAALTMTLAGCGGSSGGSTPAPQPTASMVVKPGTFDFGVVTEGNLDEVPTQRFSVENTGSASVSVSSIRLEGADLADFALNQSTGANPCGSAVFSLSPGASCDVEVRFAPRDFNTYSASLVVQSNDPVAPTVRSTLRGTYAEVLAVNLAVNQVSACPRELPAKAYVSVTDQGGFAIRGLALSDFSLKELGTGVMLDAVDSVGSSNSSLSLIIVMDYSESVTDFPDSVANMEQAAGILVQNLQADDEANVVKYGSVVKFMLDEFSSDTAELLAAVAEDGDVGRGTAFFDATVAAIDRIKDRTKDRKAIVVLTDGIDGRSTETLDTTISAALVGDIPVFTVGFAAADALELGALAQGTGGIYYEPVTADNLNAVYQQLANILFKDQYVLTYLSSVPAANTAELEVAVEFMKNGSVFGGSGGKVMLACP
jgi:hypothetical protein